MTRSTADRMIVIGAAVVIVALTGAAFWLSYAHLAEIAEEHGLSGARAWAWPATLDLGIIAGELLMLRAAIQRRTDWWAIALTVAGAGGSIVLNVWGVGANAEALDYVVAAVPPSAALLAFGVMMRQVHRWLAHTDTGTTVPVTVVPVAPKREPVVPADARMLPLVAAEPDIEVTIDRVPAVPVEHPAPVDHRPRPMPTTLPPAPVSRPVEITASVPAETPRQVVTEVVALTPTELRRRARSLHRRAVTETGRPVTIERLRTELHLSRRDAAALRREVVTDTEQEGEQR
ncbi:DUF2637 domain-containing protein [Streptomyces alkaliphilus]|uniref:DUF2637 domain-containing protein n=1 Tax=Streptomyces alkaliphilus TaxID=1472722 RepID=A0A7W3TBM1_9ACTN|nr:DUF2637 domain-containing protein [Streptomyces alkaliphilus]MBB0243871.1 DUF2637 domain-containing protein [Streptomyces alkaliphilus]